MAKGSSIPRKRRGPSLTGRLMVDTTRGVLRVRRWPKKRGTPKSEAQRFWIDWFRQANFLAKYADPAQLTRAITLTENSGLYPRDIILKAMRGRYAWWIDDAGWKWFPMAAIQNVSDTLDVLGQTVGDILYRAADRWRGLTAGAAGEVLTAQGPGQPPAWLPTGGGGGVPQQNLVGTPIAPDGSVAFYDFDVTQYAAVTFTLDAVSFAASDLARLRLSIDGGTTYRAGAGDYTSHFIDAGSSTCALANLFGFSRNTNLTNHDGSMRFTNLRAGRACMAGSAGVLGSSVGYRAGHATFDGPVTHIRLFSNGGANFNGGLIYATGDVAA